MSKKITDTKFNRVQILHFSLVNFHLFFKQNNFSFDIFFLFHIVHSNKMCFWVAKTGFTWINCFRLAPYG